jgi:ribosomal-protein-alanine N-acetyltransferase
MNLFVRPMELDDIPQVSEIEREAFPPPWPATNFKRELTTNSMTHYLVACEELNDDNMPCEIQSYKSRLDMFSSFIRGLLGIETASLASRQRVMGFAGLWFIADEAHLANIAVRETYRQQGVGEQLLIASIKYAIEHDASFITLEVRASNGAARALYAKYGFVEVGIRKGYYTDNKEDAVLMTADRIRSVSFRENFLMMCQAYNAKS